MSDAPRIAVKDLREIVSDGSELGKGVRIVDEGGLAHLARFESRLYAEAKGSGAAPYKVQVTFDGSASAKARCSCMAARSRPYCKHAAALLVAWARTPDAFAVADAPPGGVPGETKKREVKKGKTDAAAMMRGGVEQVSTLVRELAVAGVASLAGDRPAQVRALGEGLREARLRRLSARTLELAGTLDVAAARGEGFDAEDYAELMGDLLLTARKLEKHLGGEPLEERHVEELVGKTWTKKDRKPVEGLDLVEYSYTTRVTADEFVIRESRFVDLKSGKHYAEKQILPGFLAKRTPPKKSHAGRVLAGAMGSAYPGYPPTRVDLEQLGAPRDAGDDELAAMEACALPSVAAALAALQEHRKDVFAPDLFPVAIAVDTLLAEGARMQIVDATDAAVFLPDDPAIEERLSATLRGVRLRALLGDLALDGALPTLWPHAALLESAGGLELRPLGGGDAEAALTSRKVRAAALASVTHVARSSTDAARAAGLGSAAIALGEVRAEMADALVTGLAGLGARRVDPLVSRLRDLGLAKQAELLAQLPGRADPAERLDDFVKLHQVLGIALARLAGAVRVDRSVLVPVPTYESVRVRGSDEVLAPRAIAARVVSGELNRFQAAVRYAKHYEALDADELARSLYPTWADGSASPFVARAFAGRGAQALEAARRALGLDHEAKNQPAWRRPVARVAALTAIRVLELNAEHKGTIALLTEASRQHPSGVLRSYAEQALRAIHHRRRADHLAADAVRQRELAALRERLMSAADKDDRANAADALADGAFIEAIPYLRASFAGDVSREVRKAAALALGRIGDVEMVDVFVAMVGRRHADPESAKTGAYALGALGDVRGIDALLAAWVDGWQPAIVADAMREIGPAALEPLVTCIEARPELVKRKAALGVLQALPASELEEVLLARLDAIAGASDFVARAATLLALGSVWEKAARSVGAKILSLRPALGEAKDSPREEKALRKKCTQGGARA